MSSFDEFMGYDFYKDITVKYEDNTTSKKLYVYFTGNDLNNYLIGEIEEVIVGTKTKYIVKYYMDTVKQCERFEYLRMTNGVSSVNTLWVSDSPNDLDKRDIWWFEEELAKWRFG